MMELMGGPKGTVKVAMRRQDGDGRILDYILGVDQLDKERRSESYGESTSKHTSLKC